MVDNEEEKVKIYIKKELSKGFSIDKIKKALIKRGHPKKIVEKVAQELKKKKTKPKMMIIIVTITAVLIAIGGILTLTSQKEKDAITAKGINEYIEERELQCLREDIAYILCLAELHGDVSFCETFEDKIIKEICKDYFFTEPCEEIEDKDKRNNCLAEEKNDPSYCEKIEDGDTKNICLVIVLNDEKYCDRLGDERSRQICKNTFKESWPDESLCIKNQGCYDQIYFDAAIKTSDTSFCSKITNKILKDKCLKLT